MPKSEITMESRMYKKTVSTLGKIKCSQKSVYSCTLPFMFPGLKNTCRFGPLTVFALLLRLRKREKEREKERERKRERERERERKREKERERERKREKKREKEREREREREKERERERKREKERRHQPPFGPSVASLCHPWFTTTFRHRLVRYYW